MLLQTVKPRHFLDDIVRHKYQEVTQFYQQYNLVEIETQAREITNKCDFLMVLRDSYSHPSLIAEVKKASPSRGVIRENFDPVAIAQTYAQAGATCLSVLTDSQFFQGGFPNLQRIRSVVSLPLLCKDFIIDPMQIYLAKLAGANAVLLIASILGTARIKELLDLTQDLGMEALIEVHTPEEIERVLLIPNVKMLGINNRNLVNFEVNLETTKTLLEPQKDTLQRRGILVISESGWQNRKQLDQAWAWGVNAVLVGEALMRQEDLAGAVSSLLSEKFS